MKAIKKRFGSGSKGSGASVGSGGSGIMSPQSPQQQQGRSGYGGGRGDGGKAVISHVWRQCMATIHNSLDEDGLFRIEGESTEVSRILKTLQQGQAIDLSHSSIHVVASVLKRDIRERSKPLFPIKYYKHIVASQAGKTQTARVEALVTVLSKFPPHHLHDMQFLFDFLHRVSQHSAENKMTSENLAKVFAPTVMRAHDPIHEQQSLPQQIEVVRQLIEKPRLVSQAMSKARDGAAVSVEDALIGPDGREVLRMVLGADVLQFSEGNWKRETGHGMMMSEEQLERDNLLLEAENQLLALENEELLMMLTQSRAREEVLEDKAIAKEEEARKKAAASGGGRRRG